MSNPSSSDTVCSAIEPALGILDDEPAAAEQAAVAAHLQSCTACRAKAEALWRQDRALVELAAEAGVADALAARIGERLRSTAGEPQPPPAAKRPAAERPITPRPIVRRPSTLIAMAAGVLIALGIWTLRGPLFGPDGPGINGHGMNGGGAGPIEPFARIESVSGRVLLIGLAGEMPIERGGAIEDGAVLQTIGDESLATIKLADGTRLELGADTKVTLQDDDPSRADSTGKRIVLNEGFLTADVAKQPAGRPMTLSTPQAELVVLGTRFQLSGGAELTYVETAEGSVRVTRKSDGRSVVVDGGFEAAVGEGSELAARSSPPASLKQRMRLDGFFASALASDGRTLAASRFLGGEIQWWDLAENKLLHTQPAQRRRVHAMAFSPDGAVLATGGVEGVVKLWERGAALPKRTIDIGFDDPWIADVAAAGDYFSVISGAEGSEERSVSYWKWGGDGYAVGRWFVAQRWAFTPDGSQLARYDRNTKTVHVSDAGFGEYVFPTPVGNNVFSMAFSHDGKLLAVDGSSGIIVVCEVVGGRVVRQIERRGGRIFGMTFSPDDRLLATGHQDGTVRIWNLSDGTQQAVSAGGPVHNRAVAFTPDGRKLMTREIRLATDGAPRDGAVTIWEIPADIPK